MIDLRSRVIRLAHEHDDMRHHLLPLLKTASEDGAVTFNHMLGVATVTGMFTIDELTRALNADILRLRASTRNILRPRGAVKGFSFHWSNAQAAWDVIPVTRDMGRMVDGAEFYLWCMPGAVSNLGKPWRLSEMEHVASKLRHHPGYASSFDGGRRI